MNQAEVLRKVRQLAENISRCNHPENLLDIELLKKQSIELYENILKLTPEITRKLDLTPEEMRPLVNQQINRPEPEIINEEIIEEVKEPESLFSFPITPEPIIVPETIIEEVKEEIAQPEAVIEAAIAEPKIITEPESKLVNINQRDEMVLHEHLSKAGIRDDLNTKLHSKIENLKSAISLNKKIAFVNQLFKENTVEYAKAIDKLNAAANLDESLRYFNELKHTYNWNNEDELVKELQSLIEKRFVS